MEPRGGERRLAAILAADMVGYSRLMEADETGTLARLKTHRLELIDPAIAKTLHDGFKKAMEDPKFIETLDTLGQEPLYMSPDAYARYASLQMVEQKAIVEKYNLRLQ